MAHRSHSPSKTDDYRLLELELSPNPPSPEEPAATESPVLEDHSPSASPPTKSKASPQKGKSSPLKIKFPSPGKVKEMISKIERSRSHTLPTSPRSPKTPKGFSRLKGFKSEGSTPASEVSPTKKLGLIQSYFVPVKKGDDDETDEGAGNRFVGSQSLPEYEPGFFDRAMKAGANGIEDTSANAPNKMVSSHPLLSSSNTPTTSRPASQGSGNSSPSRTVLSKAITVDVKDDLVHADEIDPSDHMNVVPSSVKSVEGYIDMAKSSITESDGYVKMQPSLLTSYARPRSPINVAASPVYAVGECSSNHSDLEQSMRDLNLLSPDSKMSPRQSPEPPPSDHSGGRGSMENLFEQDDVEEFCMEEKHKGRKTIKKRFKRFFKRHRSVEVPTKSSKRSGGSASPTSSITTASSAVKKKRSLSSTDDVKVTIVEEDNTERELSPPTPSKPRSVSENDALDDDVSGYPVKRSYTMLTDHITKKYQKKILEKLRTDSGVSSGSGASETPSTLSPVKESAKEEEDKDTTQAMVDLTPPSKMSTQRYRRSLYCDQLKYKLRAALQNVHTPLSLSPIYLQLCVDDDAKCDSRYQLTLLIQHALQRSRWRHDVMEIALLTELLTMIEPLPNEL